MAWLYVPGSEASNSDSRSPSPDTEPWLTLSGKASQRPLSWRGWKTRPWIRRLSGLTSPPSTLEHGVASWIASLRASRASRSAAPASSKGSKTTAGSGRSSSASFGMFNPDGSFSKTCLDLFATDSDPSSVDWPRSGSMRNGVCSARTTLEPRTSANGSGCSPDAWTTPTVWEQNESPESFEARRQRNLAKGYNGNGQGVPLDQQTKTWPTPRAITGGGEVGDRKQELGRTESGGGDLQASAQNWPTPCISDAMGSGSRNAENTKAHAGVSLTDMVLTGDSKSRSWPTPDANMWKGGTTGRQGARPDGRIGRDCQLDDASSLPAPLMSMGGDNCLPKDRRLNPLFTEMLMGWPIGWTGSGPAGMELYHFRRLALSSLLRIAPAGWTNYVALDGGTDD